MKLIVDYFYLMRDIILLIQKRREKNEKIIFKYFNAS